MEDASNKAPGSLKSCIQKKNIAYILFDNPSQSPPQDMEVYHVSSIETKRAIMIYYSERLKWQFQSFDKFAVWPDFTVLTSLDKFDQVSLMFDQIWFDQPILRKYHDFAPN